ncbi:MAG: hypothetical protein N2Z62_09325 [Rhodobacteraceae bacterium]|nr:hypothetical protein [Paracoccaceae bacterium]
MMLIEETQVPGTALPVQALKDHLRLGTGFADTGTADSYLEELLRAALAAVEARTGKALFQRDFRWSVTRWRQPHAQALPIAPVSAILSLTLTDRSGAGTVVDAGRYWLERDSQRPRLKATGTALPAIPTGGTAEVRMRAGFGPAWTDLPAELRQAVLLIAAGYFERRHEEGAEPGAMPFGVMALIERWRTVRGFGSTC